MTIEPDYRRIKRVDRRCWNMNTNNPATGAPPQIQ